MRQEFQQVLQRIETDFEGNVYALSTLLPDQQQRLERKIESPSGDALGRELADPELHPRRLASLLKETRDREAGLRGVSSALAGLTRRLERHPGDLPALQRLAEATEILAREFAIDLRQVEDGFYRLSRTAYPVRRAEAADGDETAECWVSVFEKLGATLKVVL